MRRYEQLDVIAAMALWRQMREKWHRFAVLAVERFESAGFCCLEFFPSGIMRSSFFEMGETAGYPLSKT